MIKLNFTFVLFRTLVHWLHVLSSMSVVASSERAHARRWCIAPNQSWFRIPLNWSIISVRLANAHAHTNTWICVNQFISFSLSPACASLPSSCVSVCSVLLDGWCSFLLFWCVCVFFAYLALMKIDRECKFAIVLANCFSIEAVCQRLFNGFGGKMCTFSSNFLLALVFTFFSTVTLCFIYWSPYRFLCSKLINTMQWKIFNHIYR